MKLVVNRLRKWCAEHRDGRRKYKARMVVFADLANGVQQRARAIEVDPHSLFEIELSFARNDRRQMEDNVRTGFDSALCGCEIADVGRERFDLARKGFGPRRHTNVG